MGGDGRSEMGGVRVERMQYRRWGGGNQAGWRQRPRSEVGPGWTSSNHSTNQIFSMEGRPTTNHHLRLDQFKPLHQLDLLHGGGVQQLIIISGGVQQGEPWRRRPTNKQQPTIIIYGRCLCSEGQRNQTSWQVGKTRGFGSTRRSSEMSEEERIVQFSLSTFTF